MPARLFKRSSGVFIREHTITFDACQLLRGKVQTVPICIHLRRDTFIEALHFFGGFELRAKRKQRRAIGFQIPLGVLHLDGQSVILCAHVFIFFLPSVQVRLEFLDFKLRQLQITARFFKLILQRLVSVHAAAQGAESLRQRHALRPLPNSVPRRSSTPMRPCTLSAEFPSPAICASILDRMTFS